MEPIRDHMAEALPKIRPDAVVADAAKLMAENECRAILVEDGDRCVGIVTESDIVRKVIAMEQNVSSVALSSIMTHPLITLDASLPMEEASLCLRKNNIRQISISENKQIVGTLTFQNVSGYCHHKYLKGKDPVGEFWGDFDHAFYDQADFLESIDKLLKDIRATIGETCQTAKAIDDKKSFSEIASIAKVEGLSDLAQILDLVEEDESV